MRTTLTLEPDVELLIRETIYRSGKSFKQAVNDALRVGLTDKGKTSLNVKPAPFIFPTHKLGRPLVDLTKALALAAELEDQEILLKLAAGR
jgi:hypothetical protein